MEKIAKKVGWIGIALCGLCCSVPIIGAVAGISSLVAITYYLEKISIIALTLVGIFFIYAFYQKKKTEKARASCDVNCDCKNERIVN